MSANVLSKRDKKKALAALKKGKKKVKSILAPPELHKFRDPKIYSQSIPEICEMLKRLLPAAKLQSTPNKSDVKDNAEKVSSENTSKRVQLLLGVNVVSKGVANGTAACIFFADDIQPKLLIHHLVILCSRKEIPYVYIPNFRDLTKQTLGFPCIALGIKSNSTDFLPVINLINSLISAKKSEENTPAEAEINEDVTVENEKKEKEKKEISFQYLYRESNTNRAFVPDCDNEKTNSVSKSEDFIAVKNDDMDTEIVYEKPYSNNKFGNILGSLRDPEDLLTSLVKKGNKPKFDKRKRKIGQMGNKRGHTSIRYAPAKVMKMEANPARQKRKFEKQKRLPDRTSKS